MVQGEKLWKLSVYWDRY